MFGRNKIRIFATQEANKLNSCILISNNLSKTRPSVRTGGSFYVGKRCRSVSASGVFSCRHTMFPFALQVGLYAEGGACLGGVVVVAVYGGTGVEPLQRLYQCAQCLALLGCSRVLGCVPVCCYSAYVADAY